MITDSADVDNFKFLLTDDTTITEIMAMAEEA